MRGHAWWVVPAAAALLFGCTAQTGPDETSAGLTTVRKADYEGQIRFLDRAVSPQPLTAAELGDTTFATPVEVRFYDEWAVAWTVVDDVPRIGEPEMAAAAWLISEHVPTSGDVRDDGDGEPPETTAPEPDDEGLWSPPDTSLDSGDLTTPGYDHQSRGHLPFARLDWFQDLIEEWWATPPAFHPGCI